MQIRQYDHDMRVMQGKAVWTREDLTRVTLRDYRLTIPRVIFRDGRIFPLEHRLDNFEDPTYYGMLVRLEINSVVQISKMPAVERGDIVYCGVVKLPVLPVFAPLILWYLHVRRPDIVDEKTLLATPYRDEVLVRPLLMALADRHGREDGAFAVTFRILRRFSTLSGRQAEEVLGPDGRPLLSYLDWDRWFREVYLAQGDALRRLEDHEYAPFIEACGMVGVLEFFLHPADGRLQRPYRMPRYEILVSSWEKSDFRIRGERERLHRVLQALTPRDSLCEDSGHSERSLPLIVPTPLVHADRAASLTGEIYRQAFIAHLWEELRRRRAGRDGRTAGQQTQE